MYDISGIQKFIFATGKLKEQMGGSNIIHKIMYECLQKVLGREVKEYDAWKNKDYKPDEFFHEIKGNVVYIGGGNAMALFKDAKTMEKINRDMQKEVYKLTAGNIRLCYAAVKIENLDSKGEGYEKV